MAAGPELAAAVTNAGGMGVIGGVGYTPEFLTRQIAALKVKLDYDRSKVFRHLNAITIPKIKLKNKILMLC